MTTQQNSKLFLLRAVNGEQQLQVDRELTMGRNPASDVVLDQGGASRQHARLTPDAEGVWVEDSGSTNGTLVNGERISQAYLLKEGDQLQVGQAIFILVAHEPVADQDPDATLMYNASSDPDATQMYTCPGEGDVLPEGTPSAEQPAPPPSGDQVSSQDHRVAKDTVAGSESETSDSSAPPAWVLNNQQSVDGTAFFSKDSLQDLLRSSEENKVSGQVVGEPTLIGNSDPVMGLRYQLIGEGKHQWEIGRSPGADVMLNHESVSGAHAQIVNDGGRWKVVDLMSANGTYANGKKCLTGYLSSGDVVCFGSVECVFMLPENEQQSKPGVKPKKPAKRSGSDFRTATIAFVATAVVAGVLLFVMAKFF